jgi:type IV pilus assembly protein PilW
VKGRGRHAGFGVVELMIALVIGLLVVMSVITVWTSTRQTYFHEEDLGRIQENGRFVVESLAYELRMAGYFGCADDLTSVVSQLGTLSAGELRDASRIIEGRERGGATWQATDTAWLPSANTEVDQAAIRAGSDAVTVRYLSARRYRLTSTLTSLSESLTVAEAPGFAQGQVVGVSDCAGADLFGVSAATGTSVAHAAALSKLYAGHSTRALSFVHPYVAARYYVGTSARGRPALKRLLLDDSGGAVTEELLEGVENLQFLYGEDTGGDEAADVYVSAPDVTDWGAVRSLRMAVLLASDEEQGTETDSTAHQLLDETIPAANDRRRRRVFTGTVLVRNNR